MQGFLIFALGGGRESGEAGVLAEGNETKHEFNGDEAGDDSANNYQCDFPLTLPLILRFDLEVLHSSSPWAGRGQQA